MSAEAWCPSGHKMVVSTNTPWRCMWCGGPLSVQCPHGHLVELGRPTCPVCGAGIDLSGNPAPTALPPPVAAEQVHALPPTPPTPPAAWAPPTSPIDRLPADASPPGWDHHARIRRNTRTLVVVCAVMAALFAAVSIGVVASRGPQERPTPEHPVYGSALTLPRDLFSSSPAGSTSLVTEPEAKTVETTMWHLWQHALTTGDTRALSQLVTGPLFSDELYECTWPGSGCEGRGVPNSIQTLTVVVPMETSYPVYFMAEVETTTYVSSFDGSSASLQPWLDVQILTKASASSPWQLQFDTGYDSLNPKVPPPLLPADSAPFATNQPGLDYNPTPTLPAPVPTDQFLPELARFWQSYKTTGHPPPRSIFWSNADSSGFGQYLAESRQDAYDRYDFHADARAPAWVFSAEGGQPMECGTIIDTSVNLADPAPLHQGSDRTEYGMQLAPGQYSSITTQTIHQSCVYALGNDLVVAGVQGDAITITGAPAS